MVAEKLDTMTDTVGISIRSIHTVVLKYSFPLKHIRLLGEIVDSRSGAGKAHYEPAVCSYTRSKADLKPP